MLFVYLQVCFPDDMQIGHKIKKGFIIFCWTTFLNTKIINRICSSLTLYIFYNVSILYIEDGEQVSWKFAKTLTSENETINIYIVSYVISHLKTLLYKCIYIYSKICYKIEIKINGIKCKYQINWMSRSKLFKNSKWNICFLATCNSNSM